jgi:hypothetical protein
MQTTDWRDDKHWNCNDCVHPSRSGTYDDITMHPFETVFVKSSWHVGEPFTSHYTKWFMGHALGQVCAWALRALQACFRQTSRNGLLSCVSCIVVVLLFSG